MKKFLPRIFIGCGRIPSFTYRSMVLRLLSNRFATLVLDSSAAPGSYPAMLVPFDCGAEFVVGQTR